MEEGSRPEDEVSEDSSDDADETAVAVSDVLIAGVDWASESAGAEEDVDSVSLVPAAPEDVAAAEVGPNTITVPVGSVPDGGRVRVVVPVPVLMPVMVVNGPVNVVLGAEDEGSRTITVPVGSVPEGGMVIVEAPVAVPVLTPVIVVNGPVNVVLGDELVGSNTITVPVESVPDGGKVRVEVPVA